jgi:hypothetical protein
MKGSVTICMKIIIIIVFVWLRNCFWHNWSKSWFAQGLDRRGKKVEDG